MVPYNHVLLGEIDHLSPQLILGDIQAMRFIVDSNQSCSSSKLGPVKRTSKL